MVQPDIPEHFQYDDSDSESRRVCEPWKGHDENNAHGDRKKQSEAASERQQNQGPNSCRLVFTQDKEIADQRYCMPNHQQERRTQHKTNVVNHFVARIAWRKRVVCKQNGYQTDAKQRKISLAGKDDDEQRRK